MRIVTKEPPSLPSTVVQRLQLDRVDSTNDYARRWALQHPGQALLVSAAEQTAGRGRSGRRWQSPVGGAWFSLAWPARQPPQRYAPAPLLAGLAIIESVRRLLPQGPPPLDLALKWPNDVLLGGRKVAGVLCERTLAGEPAAPAGEPHPAVLVIGVGINANLDPAGLVPPEEPALPAGSLLAATGKKVDVPALIEAVALRLVTLLEGLESAGLEPALVRRIESHLAWRGREVALVGPAGTVAGTLLGLDALGRLRLDTPGGRQTFDSGEMRHLRRAQDGRPETADC